MAPELVKGVEGVEEHGKGDGQVDLGVAEGDEDVELPGVSNDEGVLLSSAHEHRGGGQVQRPRLRSPGGEVLDRRDALRLLRQRRDQLVDPGAGVGEAGWRPAPLADETVRMMTDFWASVGKHRVQSEDSCPKGEGYPRTPCEGDF